MTTLLNAVVEAITPRLYNRMDEYAIKHVARMAIKAAFQHARDNVSGDVAVPRNDRRPPCRTGQGEREVTRPHPIRKDHIDPAYALLPADQIDRVFKGNRCDIDPEFLGFTEIYLALEMVIPHHWTVVDLGCAYAPQAFIFKDHAAYIGVDASDCERFTAPNTMHYRMTIGEFLTAHAADFDMDTTFAICSYVPPWFGDDPRALAKRCFKNVFTYYPAGGRAIRLTARPESEVAK